MIFRVTILHTWIILSVLRNETNYKSQNLEIVSKIKEIVPEYISNNSELCELDKKEEITPNSLEGMKVLQS